MTQKDRTFYTRTATEDRYEFVGDLNDSGSNTSFTSALGGEFMDGRDLPGWKYVIRDHGNATNEAFAHESRRTFRGGSSYTNITQRRYEGEGDNPVLVVYQTIRYNTSGIVETTLQAESPGSDSTAIDLAKARFVSKARSRMTPFSGGVFLGELREAIHLVRSPAMALRGGIDRYLKDVKKRLRGRRKQSIPKQNHVVANTWLEYAFGWTPLINDVDNAMEALASLVSGVHPLEEVRAGATTEFPPDEYSDFCSAAQQSYEFKVTTRNVFKCYLYGAVDVKSEPSPTFRGAFGLRAHDVVPTVWELIPYSFVVDYFTNLGDIISAVSFNTTSLAWWGMTNTGESTVFTHDFHRISSDLNTEFVTIEGGGSPSGSYSKYKDFHRQVTPSLVPSLSFQLPGVRQGFNLAALASAKGFFSR